MYMTISFILNDTVWIKKKNTEMIWECGQANIWTCITYGTMQDNILRK